MPGLTMDRINPFAFYDFAKTIRDFTELSGETATTKVFWPLWQARGSLQRLLKSDPIPIGISQGKAQAAVTRMTELMSRRFEVTDAEGKATLRFPEANDEPISAWELQWIKTAIEEFETVFAEEMRETATYFVPRRGIYYTPALIDTADDSFPTELQSHIPQKTKDDWKSAGRCLAFNLLAASGFHVARAVEACLESYYFLFSGKTETLNGWKDYIIALRKIAATKPTPCPSEKTLAEIDQMREDYRNPIVHPRVILSEPDARMLFANGESVIIAMAQEIAKAASGVQTTLALQGGGNAPQIQAPSTPTSP
ncbi:hypothetical protein J4G43_026930 [Bradyrhizobium barranii subsp. barranii]|uniref:Uncharacterized protein n=1 Tax=Bradyrhizobium barranii subsp. barranii TaxID=2823807 RepID=A0A939S5U8_9BRAD|nr:hypothetical protein [Bradyrhizobium barranii]UEM08428.1 hypothetical protein J4G43_026930 [Bradyrhizobium barranii subsp. barranii]